jgi:hypothetical protein
MGDTLLVQDLLLLVLLGLGGLLYKRWTRNRAGGAIQVMLSEDS